MRYCSLEKVDGKRESVSRLQKENQHELNALYRFQGYGLLALGTGRESGDAENVAPPSADSQGLALAGREEQHGRCQHEPSTE